MVLIVTATAYGPIAWKPPIIWMDTFGTHTNINAAEAIAADSGGLYVQGIVNYSSSYVLGNTDYSGYNLLSGSVIVSKYDFDGGQSWMRTAGNTSEIIEGMTVAPDGIFLTGENVMGGIVQKYDKSGNQVWTEQFGSIPASNQGKGISATSTGVYVTGNLVANQTAKGFVVFVREYDSVGNVGSICQIMSPYYIPNSNSGLVKRIYAAPSGVYVVGSVFGSLQGSTRIGDNDAFLVKYDLNGGLAWIRQFGTPGFDTVALDVSGDSTGVYVSGTSMSITSGFLRKYDFSGNLVWSDQIDSHDSSGISDSRVSLDPSGVYVSLNTNREFIMKYDLNGGGLWSFQMQNSGDLSLASESGRLYVAGSFWDGRASAGMVAEVSSSPSLVFFGINPPLSFVVVGALVAAATTGLFFFRRLRKGRPRSSRARPFDRSLPVRD